MSATGRGKARVAFDYYPSPPWCVHRLLDRDAGGLGLKHLGQSIRVLEPSIGDGAIVRAVDTWRAGFIEDRGPIEWTGVELRRGALAHGTDALLAEHIEGVDYRVWIPSHRFDLALGNPPFGLMESFIRCALRQAAIVCFLARMAILESAERVAFWQHVAPEPALRVLPDRPSFDGEGTDATAYAWFVFNAPLIRGVRVLDSTPKAIRDAQKPMTPAGISQLELEL